MYLVIWKSSYQTCGLLPV